MNPTDDRETPWRVANTAMLDQADGRPPPISVLAAVLRVCGGEAPAVVATIVDWAERETTWRVVGCTDRVLFEVTASKDQSGWHGGRRSTGSNEELSMTACPLAAVRGINFVASEVFPGESGVEDVLLVGTWEVSITPGTVFSWPSHGGNATTNRALHQLGERVLASL